MSPCPQAGWGHCSRLGWSTGRTSPGHWPWGRCSTAFEAGRDTHPLWEEEGEEGEEEEEEGEEEEGEEEEGEEE